MRTATTTTRKATNKPATARMGAGVYNRTLALDIARKGGNSAKGLTKHLNAAGIREYTDITAGTLADFRDYLCTQLAPATARTYLAILSALLHRYKVLPADEIKTATRTKTDRPVKAYLTTSELRELERVETRTMNERFVLLSFLVCARTGMRVSDIRQVSSENIQGNTLSYVSIKTGIHAAVPVGERTKGYIAYLRQNDSNITLAGYNEVLRKLCERAGLNESVKLRHGGKDYTCNKFEGITSHTARVSFCTNLALAGTPIIEIARLAGHTTTAMTERYVARHEVVLNDAAMNYLINE